MANPQSRPGAAPQFRYAVEFAAAWLALKLLRILPRRAATRTAIFLFRSLARVTPRLRSIARRNLERALPGLTEVERQRILQGVYDNLGRLLAECARFPLLTSATLPQVVRFQGLENYHAALARGRGVIFLTAHLGAWELGAFAHGLAGYRLHVVYRALDNPWLDALVNRYRTLGGNGSIEKRDSARGIVSALARNETVGILADQNTLPEEGVFVNFFGIQACMTEGIARIALRTGAAVVPAFCVWDANEGRFQIIYEPALQFRSASGPDAVQQASQEMASVIERYVRKYPDQWLWIHRRWRTRPPGDPPFY